MESASQRLRFSRRKFCLHRSDVLNLGRIGAQDATKRPDLFGCAEGYFHGYILAAYATEMQPSLG